MNRSAFDFEGYVFEQAVKHAKSYDTKLPICFPFIIFKIVINQKHDIVYVGDEIGVSLSLLNFSYKLFTEKCILGILLPSIPNLI